MDRLHHTAIRAVLFDLDDTLFDQQYSSRCGLAAIQKQYPCFQQKTLAELEQIHTQLLNTWHDKVLQGVLSLAEARTIRFREFFERCGEPATNDLVDAATTIYRNVYQATRRPVPGVLPLLRSLHVRVKIAVVTNNMVSEQQEKLACCGLTPFIDILVTSEEVKVAKPEPAIFQAALDHLQCRATEVVMVGDSWSADIVGASNLGIRSVWLNRQNMACPDPILGVEIHSFEPLETTLALLLNEHSGRN